MKINKLCSLITLLVMLMTSMNMWSADVPKQKDGTFVSEIMVYAIYETSSESDAMGNLSDLLKEKGEDWTGAFIKDGSDLGNLNYGNGKDKVYILYKTTKDPRKAITDIIVASGTRGQWSNPPSEIETNGKHYRRASRGQYKGSAVFNGNLNVTGEGNDLFLYYTTDGSVNEKNAIVAGSSVIQELKTIRDGRKDPSDGYVKRFDLESGTLSNDNADCNQGAGASSGWIYIIKNNHQHNSDLKPDLSPCSCGYSHDTFIQPEIQDGACLIKNLSNLCWWRDHINEQDEECPVNAVLKANIDMTNIKYVRSGQWEPICPISNYIEPWCGTLTGTNPNVFDGRYVIKNLENESNSGPVGLFGMAGGTITNVDLVNVNLSSPNHIAAAFVQMAKGELTIKNCKLSGTVSGKYPAGFATLDEDDSRVILSRCENDATIISTNTEPNNVAFVGYSDHAPTFTQNVAIDRCVNKGDAKYAFALKPVGSITNCLNITEGSFMMKAYTNSASLTMRYVLNYGGPEIEEGTDYMPQPDCYTTLHDPESSYGEGMLDPVQITSGEACYLLNGGRSTNDVVWRQTISNVEPRVSDPYPTPLYDDMDILRVVYKFEKGVYNCEKINFTNYRFFAEDNDNFGHIFKHQSTGNIVGGKLEIHKTCLLCKKSFTEYAERVSMQIIKKPSCVNDGLSLVGYKLGDLEQIFYEEEVLESLHLSESSHFYNPEIIINDQRARVEECRSCGVKRVAYYADGIRSINDEVDMINFLEEKNTYGFTFDLNTDIDMQKVYDYETTWQQSNVNGKRDHLTFHGHNHTIKNFYIPKVRVKSGLFDHLTNSLVDNLILEGVTTGTDASLFCGIVENSQIENVIVRGAVHGTNTAAGFCNHSIDAIFTNCHNYATVDADGNSIGGIISMAQGGTMTKCTNQSCVRGETSSDVGGLVGSYTGAFNIYNCGNYGSVAGKYKVGGIVGAFALPDDAPQPFLLFANDQSLTISTHFYNCLNVGNITITGETYNKGGLFGYVDLPPIYSKTTSAQKIQENINSVDLLVQGSYYTGSQAMMGSIITPISLAIADSKCTAEELASGYICYMLNQTTESDSDNSAIWHQTLNVELHPYPYGTDIPQPTVSANNQTYFVLANSTVDEFVLAPSDNNVEYYFETLVPFRVANMRYKRNATVSRNHYATLYLPFAFSDDRFKIMEYDYYDPETGKVYFSQVTETQPNRPYLIRMADDGISPYTNSESIDIDIAASDVQIVPEPQENKIDFYETPDLATGFYGTYISNTLVGANNYFAFSAKYGDFRKANDNGTTIAPFRCTFKIGDDAPAPSKLYFVDADDEDLTGMEIPMSDIVEVDSLSPIYNLQGHQVGTTFQGLKSGIYVHKGKKVTVK